MESYSKHKKIGIGFFIAAAIFFLIFIYMVNFFDHGFHDMTTRLLDLLILSLAGALFLTGIALYWGFKIIIYLFTFLVSVIILLFLLGTLVTKFIIEPNNEKRVEKQVKDKEITEQLIALYNKKIDFSNNNDTTIITLLNEFKLELESKNINTNMKGSSLPSVEYRRFMHDKFVYLGLFFNDKYFNNEHFDHAATFWYNDSYEKYKDLFTTEAHYIRYFKLLYKQTYDEYCQCSSGLHDIEQEEYAKTVSEKGYINAYLTLVPLLKSSYKHEEDLFERQLNHAVALDLKLDKQVATTAFLNKTSHYEYYYSKDSCSLLKIISSYSVLKESDLLHDYMDLILKQYKTQCAEISRWSYLHESDKFKDAFCYIKKYPKWFEIIKLDTELKGYMMEDAYCSDVRNL